MIDRQAADRAIQHASQLGLLGAVRGACRAVGGFALADLLEGHRHHVRAAAALAGATARLVDADAVEPREELRVSAKRRQPTPGPQERLLRDLLGLMRIGAQPHHDGIQAIGMTANEFIER